MALTDAIGGVISGILAKGPAGAPDLSALFRTIDEAGAQQKTWIDALPAELKTQYDAYKAANAGAADTLSTTIAGNNDKLMSQTKANFDPNSAAVQAAEDRAKTSIYGDVQGQQDAIRQALAATGGFGRGTAAKQLAAPIITAGEKYADAVAGISVDQLQKNQAATQKAIETINTIDNTTANTLFGMTKEQALQILNGNRTDLKDQLTALIQQSQNQTSAKLGVMGADITNNYNAKVAENAADNAQTNAWVNLGVQGATAAPGFLSALNTPAAK